MEAGKFTRREREVVVRNALDPYTCTPELQHLYRTSPEYHHAVDTIVGGMPLVVEALVDSARQAEQVRRLLPGPGLRFPEAGEELRRYWTERPGSEPIRWPEQRDE